MYDFIDTNETSRALLPSEAMKIDNEYIENLVPGYRTLHVSGREALSPEIEIYETGVRDGAKQKSRRFPARTLVITYQLIAKTNEEFRKSYNKLGQILNTENAQLVFNDEPDRFYIGTPSLIGEVEPGRNAVTGEFEILCVDPFKYSLTEYEAIPQFEENSILIPYNGTYKSYPKLEAAFYKESEVQDDGTAGMLTGNGDCGYVAFFTEDEKIIQLGDPDEADGENPFPRSQTLVNQTFMNTSAWSDAAKNLWAINDGIPLIDDGIKGGSLGMGVASFLAREMPREVQSTLYDGMSAGGHPTFFYQVYSSTFSRSKNACGVILSIVCQMGSMNSNFGQGYGLMASVYIHGAWRDVIFKEPHEHWSGISGHVKNIAFVANGLAPEFSGFTDVKFKVTRTDAYGGQAGIVPESGCSPAYVSQYIEDVPETYYLTPTSYGSASGRWHGVSMTRTLSADESGEVGAKDFTLTYKQKMCIGSESGSAGQLGAFQVQLVDFANNNVAGVRIYKNFHGTSGTLVFYIKGAKVFETTIDLSYNNWYFGSKENAVQTSTIIKTGSQINFNIAGYARTFTDDSVKDMKTEKVMFAFEQYATYAPLAFNGLYWAKFVKNNCNTYRDIPNKFSANDVVLADCKNGEVFLNGILSQGLGALGNDWEGFCLTPGFNQIGFSYSDWVSKEKAPSFKVKYREVYL